MKQNFCFLLAVLVLLELSVARKLRTKSDTLSQEEISNEDDRYDEATKSDLKLDDLINRSYRLLRDKRQCSHLKRRSCAIKWLTFNDEIITEILSRKQLRSWNYESNMTSFNANLLNNETIKSDKIHNVLRKQAKHFRWRHFLNQPDLKRAFRIITASATLHDVEKQKMLLRISSKLEEIYASVQVYLNPGENEPNKFMSSNNNYEQLLEVWQKWYDTVGKSTKSLYTTKVKLLNQGAKENGYNDFGHAEWSDDVKQKNFPSVVRKLFHEIKPFFEQLHAFVRHRLLIKYPGKFLPDGVIPAHLLGNLWAQTWDQLENITTPFAELKRTSVTEKMQQQNYTVKKIVRTAEQFFTSLGLFPMTQTFWKKSILEFNPNVTMECHPSATDLLQKDDYRIQMCSDITFTTLQDVHHEMGHVEYFMAYSNLPIYYRDGANSGFHEAIGDTIALSLSTSAHLYKIGLSDYVESSREEDINFLMNKALNKVALLPFALTVDQWRWSVAKGRTTPENYNENWWILRESLQGIGPPVDRSEKNADALGKYHIVANVPYIRYFMSVILQFQFYKALCKEADNQDNLHKCDFYDSKVAGKKLLQMMSLGGSKPWPDALEVLTGSRELDTGPLLEYFQPLMNWLIDENKRNNLPIGWKMPANPLASVTLL